MKNNIKYLDQIPKDYFENLIGLGNRAMCYKGKDNKVYKMFAFGTKPSVNKLNYLSNINIDRFIFPEKILLKNENSLEDVDGYIMEYIEGTRMNNENFIIDINILLQEIIYLESLLMNLSQHKISLFDIQPCNMIYGIDNKIHFIDTDCYGIDEENILENNSIQFNKGFENLLLPTGFKLMVNNIFLNDIDLASYYHDTFTFGKVKLSTFLKSVLEYFNDYDIKTNIDLKNALSIEVTKDRNKISIQK